MLRPKTWLMFGLGFGSRHVIGQELGDWKIEFLVLGLFFHHCCQRDNLHHNPNNNFLLNYVNKCSIWWESICVTISQSNLYETSIPLLQQISSLEIFPPSQNSGDLETNFPCRKSSLAFSKGAEILAEQIMYLCRPPNYHPHLPNIFHKNCEKL